MLIGHPTLMRYLFLLVFKRHQTMLRRQNTWLFSVLIVRVNNKTICTIKVCNITSFYGTILEKTNMRISWDLSYPAEPYNACLWHIPWSQPMITANHHNKNSSYNIFPLVSKLCIMYLGAFYNLHTTWVEYKGNEHIEVVHHTMTLLSEWNMNTPRL